MTQFRRSKKIGPFRVSVSKKGVGYSVGNNLFRVGRGTDGKTRRTVRVPGTGIYDIKTVGGKKNAKPKAAPRKRTPPEPQSIMQQASPLSRQTHEDVTPNAYRVGPFRYGEVRLPVAITFHGYGGTIDFDGYTVSITRGKFMRLMGRGSVAFPITAVHAVGVREPTRVRNGYIRFLVPGPDSTVVQPLAVEKDLHAVMVTWQKRKMVGELRAALSAAEKAGGETPVR
jgi:hypothetical protein